MGAKADRKLLTIAGLFVLAGFVAVASQGASVWAPPRPGGRSRAEVLATVTLVFVLGSVVAAALVFALRRTILARRSNAPPLRTLLLRALPTTTAALVALSLLALTVVDLGSGGDSGNGPTTAAASSDRRATPFSISNWFDLGIMAGEGDEPEEPGGSAPEPAQTPPLFLLAGAVAAALAVASAAWWYANRSRSSSEATSDRDTAHGAVLGTIDAMLADPDPRTAIIGAYARLLEELAAVGGTTRARWSICGAS